MENKDFNTTSYKEQVEAKKELILKMAEINADETKNKTNKGEEFLADTVKVLSPGQMVLKRFFRSRLSMVGLVTIIVLFLFSFLGPIFSPWGEVEDDLTKADPVYSENYWDYTEMYDEDIVKANNPVETKEVKGNKVGYFVKDGEQYDYVIRRKTGKNYYYKIIVSERDAEGYAADYEYAVWEIIETIVMVPNYNAYDEPSLKHWLGTDDKGYDVFTRLMYGGQKSLSLSFIVIIMQTLLGIIMGGLAGYFGKWVDMLVMRIVDLLYCLPTMPLLLVISSVLDGQGVPPKDRIYFLLGILTLIGWAGTARLVRGQILGLREQEFMLAAEATGLSPFRKIFKHLIPNVMPQLIVAMTLGLGSVILTESTLSYLGLGIPIPYAAWGTMISLAKDPTILQYYINMWVPPGVMIVLAVLSFNFVGDGLRDAFDPKMKR